MTNIYIEYSSINLIYSFRAKMKELVGTIQRFTQQHAERVFLYEIIVAELALHKGADINQMTQQSGNPDVTAQCNHHDMLKVTIRFCSRKMNNNPCSGRLFAHGFGPIVGTKCSSLERV